MKRAKQLISMLLLGAMCMSLTVGCAPAADQADGAAADTAGSGTASTYESLEAVDISEYTAFHTAEDFLPADLNVSGTKEDGTKWKIAWCSPDSSDESMAYMDQLMQEEAEELGFEVVSFDAQSDPQKQTDQINNAVNQGCDAIIVNPVDNSSAVGALKSAHEAGVVVVNAQNIVNDESVIDNYVGPNDKLAGQLAASLLIEAMPEGGTVCVIEGFMGSTAQINRDAGFMGVMQNHPEFEIVDMQSANWSTAEAMNIMESDLAKFDEIDAVFSHFDLATLAAIQACENVGRDGEIAFVSVDGTQGAVDKIGEGSSFLGTAMQDFALMTEIQCKVALADLNGDGDKLEKIIEPAYTLIVQDNAEGVTTGWG